MSRCIIHRWFYIATSNGAKNPFTGRFITRQDRFCQDCDKMQISIKQFPKDKQQQLKKLAKVFTITDWITFKEGDEIDRITRRWLKNLITK